MNPSDEFRKFACECRAMAKFARSPESEATWDLLAARIGAPNSMKSIRRRQRVTGSQGDIEGPSIAGPSATRLPEPSRYPTATKSRRWGGVEDRGPRQILAFTTSPWPVAVRGDQSVRAVGTFGDSHPSTPESTAFPPRKPADQCSYVSRPCR
jgi:hypothetical protein